ncbi:ATP synthase subunit gamma, mitochondrial [Olea europaea subsp. europaea]|uniref:F-ATPase gamma subunit n=1 Tax=Olea europaea subsp. europaea TaxID=158383 RepID=A0A8S0UB44_OLEEU|nr:ATP synthase subunit gamma, mitochondrial [Olea europaea subsp. europaea]
MTANPMTWEGDVNPKVKSMEQARNCLLPMGVTSENVAHRFGVTRQEKDQAAVIFNQVKSVRNIQKITKAMKMVAVSKLRAIQTRTENSCGLWQPFTALLGDTPRVDVKKNFIVTISSDKGLCGGINSTSAKINRALHKLNSVYAVLEENAKAQLVRDSKKDIEFCITELQKNPLNYIRGLCLFHSVLSFMPTAATVSSPERVPVFLSHVQCSPRKCLHRNTRDMLDRLTLTYNRRTCQASITTELIEIISGASALEG